MGVGILSRGVVICNIVERRKTQNKIFKKRNTVSHSHLLLVTTTTKAN